MSNASKTVNREEAGTVGPERLFFVILPKFSLISFSAAIETLRMANEAAGRDLFQWQMLSLDGQPIQASNGLSISVDSSLKDLPRRSQVYICAGTDPGSSYSKELLHWIRRQSRHGISFGSICTGVFALAEAGLLRNREFTLHWEYSSLFQEKYSFLEPLEQLFVNDGDLWTCAGGVASVDMLLCQIAQTQGAKISQKVLDLCIHSVARGDRTRQRSSYLTSTGTRNKKLARALSFVEENFQRDFSIGELASVSELSRRQLERLFAQYLNQTPRRYLNEFRLERSLFLIVDTDLSVSETAIAAGFPSFDTFRKRFKERFGVTPSRFRSGV